MSFLVLGIAVMIGLILAGNWFVSANPKTIIKALKWLLIGLFVAIVLFFIISGRLGLALWALPALLPWLLRARTVARAAKNFSRMAGSSTQSGQASTVSSRFLEMELDHDTGDMSGFVRAGDHAGRKLESLSISQLMELFQQYQDDDVESARLLAAYLDREHPDWREDDAAGENQEHHYTSPHSGQMDRAEALRVLGLDDPVDEAEIKAAYHRLIGSMHPDRGGSAYLTAKINEARDVLLDQ